jgi:hypothetical protein
MGAGLRGSGRGAMAAADGGEDEGGGLLSDFQQNCKLLLCPFWLPFCSLQSGKSLLNNCTLLIKNRQLLDQFVIEFYEFSNCLGFITAED